MNEQDLPTVDCMAIVVAKVKKKRQHKLSMFFGVKTVKHNSNDCITVQTLLHCNTRSLKIVFSFYQDKAMIGHPLNTVLCTW